MKQTNSTFTHPEVFGEVLAEFKRLHDKHPTLDGTAKWAMARDLAWTLALADSSLLKAELGIR